MMKLILIISGMLWMVVDCSLRLCERTSTKTIGMDRGLHKEILFTKSSPFVSNIFSYATINVSSDVPFVIDGSNSSGYWSSLISGSNAQSVYVKDKLSCFDDFKLVLTLKEPSDISIKIIEKRFDRTSMLLFLFGSALLINAKSLSRSTCFMYTSCASVGMLASCLILLIILYRLIPYKRMMAFFVTVGSGIWFYLLNHLQDVLGTIILKHPYHVATYLSISALISVSLLYYFGVPVNTRALNLLQWFMQLAAIYIIYFSCYSKTFAVTITVILLIFQYIGFSKTLVFVTTTLLPRKVVVWLNPPPKHRFLTLDEYEQQAREETEKGLKELQHFCTSPKCSSWNVVSKINDPKRFASFLMTGNQFTNDEMDLYYVENEEDELREQVDEDASLEIVYKHHDASSPSSSSSKEQRPESTAAWISDDEREQSLLTE